MKCSQSYLSSSIAKISGVAKEMNSFLLRYINIFPFYRLLARLDRWIFKTTKGKRRLFINEAQDGRSVSSIGSN